ncbi:carboxypeptidase N subunit 2-like [Mytilus edulis]|uniref:carboxypeptidase N subunit 2-like n=1 Tax=Mytilus edulis TaxID=6550 RepID=UPI0039EE0DD6
MKLMMKIVVYCIVITVLKADLPCPVEECSCENGPIGKGRIINCRDKSLTSVPKFQPSDEIFLELTLSNSYDPVLLSNGAQCPSCNKITFLPPTAFRGLRLQGLDLSKNQISQVSDTAFEGLESYLEELSIDGDKTISPPYSAMSRLSNLKSLSLRHFNQAHMNRQNTMIDTLVNLETLELKYMDVSVFSNDLFLYRLPKLTKLHLEGLPMREFPVKQLKPLKYLEKLYAVYMQLENIPYGAFQTMTNLKELVLSHNKIETLYPGCFDGIGSSLKVLGLHLNNLDETKLGPLASTSWSQLEKINLGHNKMNTIPNGLFFNMRDLNTLNLDSNKIATISKGALQGLDKLENLDLSYNTLDTINKDTFLSLIRLRVLDLRNENGKSSTGLFKLTVDSVNGLKQLQKLILTDTTVDEAELWKTIQYLENLVVLELGGTDIKEIPDLQFTFNRRLSHLMLERNSISILTQAKLYGTEKSLESINLQQNSIKTIDRCVFANSTALKSMFLYGNPLRCDCEIKWLQDWIRERSASEPFFRYMVNGMCQSPEHLKNVPIWNIQGGGLTCGPSYQIPVCKNFENTAQTIPTPTVRTTEQPAVDKSNNFKFTKVSETDHTIEITWEIRVPSMVSTMKLEYQKLGPYPTIYPVHVPKYAEYYKIQNVESDSQYLICMYSELYDAIKPKERICVVIKTL